MEQNRRLEAVVQTFHVDKAHMPELAAGLDEAVERFTLSPHFGGLLCLEKEGLRQQVTVVVLWDPDTMELFSPQVDEAHREIAASTDLGVTTQSHRVVRFVPGVTRVLPQAG